jgi:hypothetical protein
MNIKQLLLLTLLAPGGASWAGGHANLVPIGKGWAKNFVNANILRHNSVVSHQDTQYVAYYAEDAFVVLARRKLDSEIWEINKTQYQGNITDAHNTISIMVDGDGYLHMSWDHHNNPLRYCRSKTPGALDLTAKMPMTGKKESKVTYPEFYRLPNGNLLFMYRDGQSGNGNLMMNHYDVRTKIWTQRQDAFINGEGEQNAYWQMCIDSIGTIHISWVWREHGGVETNHDMGYAKSTDEGKTWQKSNGEKYRLPITASSAEYAARIPPRHELINTTSMCADAKGRPYIAAYWRPQGTQVPQYHIIHHNGSAWITSQITHRKMPYSLSGGGTKRLIMSRPCIIADSNGLANKAYMLFRDTERGDRISVAICSDLNNPEWTFKYLTDFSVGMWEPSYDNEMWRKSNVFHIYVQKVGQGDGETLENLPPSEISILEWKPQ